MCPYDDAAYGTRYWNTLPHARHGCPMHASTPQAHATSRTFAQRLSSTRRGACLARLLAVERLAAWDI
ncbi:hypothetical protein SVIOM342S_05009 [Streptomyces violaceorubidus]